MDAWFCLGGTIRILGWLFLNVRRFQTSRSQWPARHKSRLLWPFWGKAEVSNSNQEAIQTLTRDAESADRRINQELSAGIIGWLGDSYT
jgi:hypothetical protein